LINKLEKEKIIGVKGAYGEQNFGDDAIMLFLYRWFKKKKIDVVFIGKPNSYVNKLFPGCNYILKGEEHKYDFDLLILGGGTQAFSFSKVSKLEKLKGYLWILLSEPKKGLLKLAHFLKNKIIETNPSSQNLIGLGIGFGPFLKGSKIQVDTEQLIKRMEVLYVRDSLSYEFASQHNNNTYLYSDICYLTDIMDLPKRKNKRNTIKSIGVIIRDWKHDDSGNKYYQKLQTQILELRNDGYIVQYILFKEENYWIKYLRKNDEQYIIWQPNEQSIEDFIEVLGTFDLFISARFHGVIFGALLGIPSISIEVEQKLALVSRMIYGHELVWKQPFNSEELRELLSRSQIEYDSLIQKINESNRENMLKSNQMFNDLLLNLK
jgi:polysaccharide pyruvyl transferase WcaK-like protein